MINSREITELDPELQAKYWELEKEARKAGIAFIVTSTYRDQECQDKLFAKGRTSPGPPCSCGGKTRPIGTCKKHSLGLCVTWIRHSKHQDRKAFDIAIVKLDKTICWDVKVDVNKNDIPDYMELALIGQRIGLKPGALWKNKKDYPHYEI
jgi:peptidoglycan L-alanyl-D-glutamate endopeptidase CwlK